MFDGADQILRKAADIKQRAVVLRTMPLANLTGITREERAALGAWVDQGAQGPETAQPAATTAPAPAPRPETR